MNKKTKYTLLIFFLAAVLPALIVIFKGVGGLIRELPSYKGYESGVNEVLTLAIFCMAMVVLGVFVILFKK